MFSYPVTVRLHDTDAAGRLYFANQFRLAHEAYEAFMKACGHPLPALLAKGRQALPIVHAAADFRTPLSLGQELSVEIKPLRIGKTSFTLVYRLVAEGRTVGHVTTVHVAIDAKRGSKQPLPARLRAALQKAAHGQSEPT